MSSPSSTSRRSASARFFGGDSAVCIDNDVFLPTAFYRSDFGIAHPDVPASTSREDKEALAWLIHECCHAWQFQAKVRRYHWYKALLEHIKFGSAAYDYDIGEKNCFSASPIPLRA